jgi:dipeptidyl aminopeptidase/acylaminoacyl peptidase
MPENNGYTPLAGQYRQRPGNWEGKLTSGMIAQGRKVGSAVWSPDSRYVFYMVDYNGRCDILRLELATKIERQITTDMEAPGLLVVTPGGMDISPDGSKLIYPGGKDGKLYLIDSGGGVAKRLVEGEGAQVAATFSKEGRIAFAASWGENQAIAVADAEPGNWARRISKGDNSMPFAPRWSADGKSVFYAEYDSRMMPWSGTRLVQTDVTTGETKVIRDGLSQNISYTQATPSPDGKWLAYSSDETGWANLYLTNLANGETHPLITAEAEYGEPTWSPDGSKLAYTISKDCNISVGMSTLEGQHFTLAEGAGVCNGLSWSPDGKYLSYVKQSVNLPTNLWLYDLAKGESKPLTNYQIGGLAEADLVTADQVRWTSPDGLEIEGLFFKPEKIVKGKHPMLLHVHGGPISQYNRRWDSSVQYWVNRGWVVVEPNFRGSTGYGRSFRDKLNGTWGQEDMLDNIGAIELMKKEGLIDPSRVVAWGGSGGGYATMMLLAKWAELFRAGVALVGVSNFVSFPEQTDRLARYLIESLLGLSADNYALHEERSPVYFAHQIKSPLMIMMGAEDRRVPAKQGEEMVEALKKAGRTDFEYISYPGEGHGWRKAETIVDYFNRMGSFLQKWVLDR